MNLSFFNVRPKNAVVAAAKAKETGGEDVLNLWFSRHFLVLNWLDNLSILQDSEYAECSYFTEAQSDV